MTLISDRAITTELVASALGIAPEHRAWLDGLAALAPVPAQLPHRTALPALFEKLDIPHNDRRILLDLLPRLERPEAWWLLERCHHLLVTSMGREDPIDPWPELPGLFGRYFYVFVYLSTLADVRRFHAQRNISDSISWATLADLGQHMAVHRANRGTGGVHARPWLTRHFRGIIYSLGRLQFNMYQYRPAGELTSPIATNSWVLGVHIPETGPLAPEACDESFQRARKFFPQHFSEYEWSHAICHSWLLDPQLADYLPAVSNIVRFGERFTPVGDARDGDRPVLEFVFHQEGDVIWDAQPQTTNLERAVIRHLKSGLHWQVVSGYVKL
jgi:hypothetical protein